MYGPKSHVRKERHLTLFITRVLGFIEKSFFIYISCEFITYLCFLYHGGTLFSFISYSFLFISYYGPILRENVCAGHGADGVAGSKEHSALSTNLLLSKSVILALESHGRSVVNTALDRRFPPQADVTILTPSLAPSKKIISISLMTKLL